MRLLAAELQKIWTAPRTLFGLLLAETALVLFGVITLLHSYVRNPELSDQPGRDVVSNAQISLLFAVLIGVLIVTTEYRHGTITLTFLTAPVREKVLAAKAGAAVIASAFLVFPAVLLSVGIAQIWVGARDDYHFGNQEWELVGRLFLTAAFVAIIGLFIGASLKRQLAAVILVLGWLFFVEVPLLGFFPGTRDYMVLPALGGLLGDGGDVPSFARSLAVFVSYAVGLGALAVGLTRRRDIT